MAPAAHAAFGIEHWEALTCKENVDTPGLGDPPITGLAPLPKSPGQCTEDTEDKWFTQAAGHPNFGVTDFTLNTFPSALPVGGFPQGFVKDIIVDTPEGLSVNPEALPQCKVEDLEKAACSPESLVGINYLTVAAAAPSPTCAPFPTCPQARVALPVYNLVPFEGVPSMVGFVTESGPTFIVGSLSPKDQHVTFTISDIHPPSPTSPPIIGSRLVFFGNSGNGTYLTMPSNCGPGQTSTLRVDQQTEPGVYSEKSFTTKVGASGCDKVPFKPTINVSTAGGTVDSPEATTVDVGIPWNASDPIANSYLKEAKVILPEGMGINPSSANGLETCTEAQFGKGTNNPITCPKGSVIGTVDVQTPSLPPNTIGGTVYVGEPLKNGPGASATGEQFRIFIHAFSEKRGVNVRLIGKIFLNAQTGQVTAVVPENPQATFSNFRVHINGGPKGTLTSPPTCGPNVTNTEMTPWSENPDQNKPSSSFTLTSAPGGGSCPKSLGERPFSPSYSAKSDSSKAGAYSPFRVNMGRADGQQELKAVNVTLPKGLTGKLAGIPYCSEQAIAAAQAASGKAEQAHASCSAESAIGSASITAGTGSEPFKTNGTAYLAGPYKGAPLSLVIVTPAVAGPYDLGTVVVRVALNVNPETAQVNAVSDAIPNVFGGVKLDIRSIDVNVDRSNFMLNPTNCAAQATTGSINGGGSNPANSSSWSSYAVSSPFQAVECNKLGFKPKLFTRISGPTTRAKNPQIRAVLEARNGDANIARTALTLPHSLFLDQSHIRTVCTRPQLASQSCPKAAQYGYAKAKTPLLSNMLQGPVYLVSSNHKLPDLVADLRGQVNIQLHGVIGSKHGGLKTVFNPVPDVPVKKFILTMQKGKKSLVVNSTNLCTKPQRAVLNIGGQNGKKVKNNKYRLNVTGCKKHKKK
ncbi:MAG TPA: hypothetical protein VHA54_09135 [Solirubrobacterales bacterium]|nr:hypothetical protein [Solirubrobacterales bacterium]